MFPLLEERMPEQERVNLARRMRVLKKGITATSVRGGKGEPPRRRGRYQEEISRDSRAADRPRATTVTGSRRALGRRPTVEQPDSARETSPTEGAMAKRARTTTRKYGKKAQKSVESAMRRRKRGTLKSGRSGRKVKSRKQAIAIGLSEARKKGAKVPPRKTRRASRRHRNTRRL